MVEANQHAQKWEQVASEAKEIPVEPTKALAVVKESIEQANQPEGGVNTNNETTVKQYFHYYSKLVNQQNMLQDNVRT
jgi:hypothetical protein